MQEFQVKAGGTVKMCFSPDGQSLAISSGVFTLLNTASGSSRMLDALPWSASFAFVRGGTAIAYTKGDHDEQVQVFDLASGNVHPFGPKHLRLHGVFANPNSDVFYVWFSTSNYYVGSDFLGYRSADLELAVTLSGLHCLGGDLVTSANGEWFADRNWSTLWVWNIGEPEHSVSRKLELKTRADVNDHALSADGSRLVAGDSYALRVWDTASGEPVAHSGKHRRGVTAVACCPARPLIASGDNAGHVFLWDHACRVLNHYDWGLGEVDHLCFAADGLRCAAIDSKGKVVVWDVDV